MTPLIDPRSSSKTLIVMRHGEAAMPWGTGDFDRQLTERGAQQAAAAGHWMVEQGLVPEMIVCSAALRTRQTCTWVCDSLGEKAPTASLEEQLYNCSPQHLQAVVGQTPETVRALLVIAHYPAVQEAALSLASRGSDYEALMDASGGFPPSGTAVLAVDKPWAALDGADADLVAFRSH